MKAKITEKWLVKKGACEAGVEAFKNQKEKDSLKILKKLIRVKKLDWANWLIVRVMTYKQYVSYAIYGAEKVIGIFEKKYPNDNRPRAAINAAKKCIKNPTKKNKAAADAAATDAANAAADAAYAAADAAYAADYAAYAAYSADAATYAAYAADAATYAAADAAADAAYTADAAYAAYPADAATAKTKLKILKYGISLLKEGKK